MKKLALGIAPIIAVMAGPAFAEQQAPSRAEYDCANFNECAEDKAAAEAEGAEAAPVAGKQSRVANATRGMNIAGRFGKTVTEPPANGQADKGKAGLARPRSDTAGASAGRARVKASAVAPRPVAATAASTRLRLAQGITFATGSADLTAAARANVDVLAQSLLRPEKIQTRFRIEGHTDAVGDAAANKSLSERRAAAVLYYLVTKGVSAGRLELAGFGETALLEGVAPNAPENRRVVAKLIN
jgi:outer membrane protein OmpA-like peptidoglycan-associated protein